MKKVLAIDPGRSKCGIAIVGKEAGRSEILFRDVWQVEDLEDKLGALVAEYEPNLIAIGNGTNTKPVQSVVRNLLPGRSVLILDEKDTSMRARERYWEHTPRKGWRRLLPSTMQVPPVPIDDFVAIILAERVLSVE